MRLFFFVLSLLALSACSSMNDNFSCPSPKSGMCKSVDAVDEMVTAGKIGGAANSAASAEKSAPTYPPIALQYSASAVPDVPVRKEDKVMQIWIAPYEDKAGNYHTESSVFAVLKTGAWA